MHFYEKDTLSAFKAMEYAQFIAFAPSVFQAARVLRDTNILKIIEDEGLKGISFDDIVEKAGLPMYGVRVLVEAGLGIGLILSKNDRYHLTKAGYFLLNDPLTRSNMDFSHDVNYLGMFNLEDSIRNGKPEGLKVFGNWKTIYEALAHLPEHVRKSWFQFDHYYSDGAFPDALPVVFKYQPKKLIDIGGNTGKWTLQCIQHDPEVHITILDLPGQLNMARENIARLGFADRVSFYEIDLLDETQSIPKGHDAIWMSQFLDCFSDDEIVSILKRCYDALDENGHVFILEPFWDRQKFAGAAFSLQQTSLYFTAMANGNSQMYNSAIFIKLVEKAGFKVIDQVDELGVSHTLLTCVKK